MTHKILHRRINIDINQYNSKFIAQFDESINYSLNFDDNKMKIVTFKKYLPDIKSADFFDIKVTSKDVNILKHEIIDDISFIGNFNTPRKCLVISFENKNSNLKNYLHNSLTIEYSYKTEDIQDDKNANNLSNASNNFEITKTSQIFSLKDVEFNDIQNSNINDAYNTEFNIFIKNLPEKIKIRQINCEREEIQHIKKHFNSVKERVLYNLNNKLENLTEFKFSKINSKKGLNIEFIISENNKKLRKLKKHHSISHNNSTQLNNKNKIDIISIKNKINPKSRLAHKSENVSPQNNIYNNNSQIDFIYTFFPLLFLGILYICFCGCCLECFCYSNYNSLSEIEKHVIFYNHNESQNNNYAKFTNLT